MDPKVDLAEFVMDHLSRGGPTAPYLGAVCNGLTLIAGAFNDAQEQRGNWGGMLSSLRSGIAKIEPALPTLRKEAGLTTLVGFAERQVRFAGLVIDEIIRLQAGESTGA